MQKKSRITKVMLLVILFSLLLYGCGQSETTTQVTTTVEQTPGETTGSDPTDNDNDLMCWQLDTSPVTLEIFVNYSWWSGVWGEDEGATMRATAETGVTIIESKPVSGDDQRLNLMIAGNDLPDMVLGERNIPQFTEMIEADLLYSLDDLMDQYAPEMRDMLDPDLLSNYRYADGKTYRAVSWIENERYRETALEYNALVGTNQQVLMVRKDFYDAIGRPAMDTPEKFIEALEEMKANNPDKIGFYGHFRNAMGPLNNHFGVVQHYVMNDEVMYNIRDPQYLESMLFLNTLAQKDLLPREAFIDEQDVVLSKLNNGDFISFARVIADSEVNPADNPNTNYEVLPPFESYRQVRTGTGWNALVVTKNTEHPDRCIRFLCYLNSDAGHKTLFWGVEGEEYGDYVNGPHFYYDESGKPTYFREYINDRMEDWGGVAQRSGLDLYSYFGDSLKINMPYWDKSDEKMGLYNSWFGQFIEYRPEYELIVDPTLPEGAIMQRVNSLIEEYVVKMVFARDAAEAEAYYHEMIEKCEAVGLADLEAYRTNLYRNNIN